MRFRNLFLFLFVTLISYAQNQGFADSISSVSMKDCMAKAQERIFNLPDSAIYYYLKALKIAQKQHNLFANAEITGKLGGVYYTLGDYDLALEYYNSSLEKFIPLGNKHGIAAGYNNCAMIYNMQKKMDDAIAAHQKSLNICNPENDKALIGINYFNLGIVFWEKKEYDKALLYSDSCFKLFKSIERKDQYCKIYNLQGYVQLELGNTISSEKLFFKAIECNTNNNTWELSYSYGGLAKVKNKQKKYKEGIVFGQKAYKLAKEINAKWDLQITSEILAENYLNNKQFDSAYAYLLISKEYSDSIFNMERERHINYLQLLDLKRENENLSNKQIIQQQQLDTKKRLNQLYVLVIVILVGGIIIIIFKHNEKNKISRQLILKNKKIEEQNIKLNKLMQTKDTLFRIIAHDLRSPMATVVSFSHHIIEEGENLEKEELLSMSGSMHRSSLRALELLQNLLSWSKHQVGEIKNRPSNIKLYYLIEDVRLLFEKQFELKQISFQSEIRQEQEMIVDKSLLSTILRNLISNALKFTPNGGEIKIIFKEFDINYQFLIEDTGIGMNESTIERILNTDNMLSTSGTLGEKGSGLGLILCRNFIHKMNGKIWIESQIKKGTSIFFTIPKNQKL